MAVKGRVLSGIVHHAVFDWASVGILWESLMDPDGAAAPERTLRDYAAWEAEQPEHVEDWVEFLGDAAPRFGGTPEVSAALSTAADTVHLDAVIVQRFEAWCRSRGVGTFALALWVTRATLAAYSDDDGFALGVAYDVRPPALRHTVGCW